MTDPVIRRGTAQRLGLRAPLKQAWGITANGDSFDWACGRCGETGSTQSQTAAEQELYGHAMAVWTSERVALDSRDFR